MTNVFISIFFSVHSHLQQFFTSFPANFPPRATMSDHIAILKNSLTTHDATQLPLPIGSNRVYSNRAVYGWGTSRIELRLFFFKTIFHIRENGVRGTRKSKSLTRKSAYPRKSPTPISHNSMRDEITWDFKAARCDWDSQYLHTTHPLLDVIPSGNHAVMTAEHCVHGCWCPTHKTLLHDWIHCHMSGTYNMTQTHWLLSVDHYAQTCESDELSRGLTH